VGIKEQQTNRPVADPVVKQYREQISDNDVKILEALNKRIKLVQKLKKYKESQGFGFVDPRQEDWVLTYLSRSNQGPLCQEALREIYGSILEVVKREVARIEGEDEA